MWPLTKECDINVIFVGPDQKESPPRKIGDWKTKPLPRPEIVVENVDQKYDKVSFRLKIADPSAIRALEYSIVRGTEEMTPVREVPFSAGAKEINLNVPTDGLPKGEGYHLRLYAYSVLKALEGLAERRGLFSENDLRTLVTTPFRLPPPLQPTTPFTVTIRQNDVSVSTKTPEATRLKVAYKAGSTIEQTSASSTDPAVNLALDPAVSDGLQLTLWDANDLGRKVQTELKVVVDVPKGTKLRTQVANILTDAKANVESSEKLQWKEIVKTGLGAVIKFLSPVP